MDHKTVQNLSQLIDLVMRIEFNSNNFIPTIFRFSGKFDRLFSLVFIFENVFPESHGFVAVPITSSNNFVSLH